MEPVRISAASCNSRCCSSCLGTSADHWCNGPRTLLPAVKNRDLSNSRHTRTRDPRSNLCLLCVCEVDTRFEMSLPFPVSSLRTHDGTSESLTYDFKITNEHGVVLCTIEALEVAVHGRIPLMVQDRYEVAYRQLNVRVSEHPNTGSGTAGVDMTAIFDGVCLIFSHHYLGCRLTGIKTLKASMRRSSSLPIQPRTRDVPSASGPLIGSVG